MAERGILYVAIGEKYLEEALHAAERATKVTDLPISLVAHRDIDHDIFDQVIVDEEPEFDVSDKSKNLRKTPYEKTIYLDSDTYLAKDVSGLFECLQQAPLAVTLDPHEGSLYSEEYESDESIPKSFPEYQTGVIAYEKSPIVEDFLDTWVETHSGSSYPDQLSFREAVYQHTLSPFLFPSRYNKLMANVASGPVIVLHDNNRTLRGLSQEQLHRVLEDINDFQGVRIPFNSYSTMGGFGLVRRLIPFQFSLLIMRHGYRGLYYGFRDMALKTFREFKNE